MTFPCLVTTNRRILLISQGGNGLPTDSPEDCAAECEKRSECQFWTYVKGWKMNCYLKSTFSEKNQKDGAFSGSIGMECDEGEITWKDLTNSVTHQCPSLDFLPGFSFSGRTHGHV